MKTASYFSGIGGMDLGLERAGFDIISQCEKDEYRREVLSTRFPGAQIYEDISEVYYGEPEGGSAPSGFLSDKSSGRKTRAGLPGSIDLLCGGFPCQDLSVAGRRAGLAGSRSGLFFEFARIAEEAVRDGGFVLIENVPGLFSSNEGEDFRIVLETLYECGFNDISWRTLNSQYFGVPQRRRRVFILGRRARGTSCGQILLEPEGSDRNSKSVNETWEKDSIAALTGLGSGGADDNDAQNGRLVTSTLQAHKNGYRMDADSIEQYVSFHLRQDPISSDKIYPALSTTSGGMGISGPLTSRYWKGINSTMDDGAMVPEQTGVRRLTPVECERLQGLPDNWTQLGNTSDTKRYSAIGDAVTVPVAEWIGRRILYYADK